MATAKKKNKALRLIVPLIVAAAAALFVIGTFFGPNPQQRQNQQAQQQAEETQPVDEDARPEAPPAGEPRQLAQPLEGAGPGAADDPPAGANEPPPEEETLPGEEPTELDADEQAAPAGAQQYRVRPLYDGEPFTTMGSSDPDSGYEMSFEVSRYGAGIRELVLSDFWKTVDEQERYALVAEQTLEGTTGKFGLTPMAVTWVKIDDAPFVSLYSRPDPGNPDNNLIDIWHEIEPGRYEALIVDENDEPVLRIERRYFVEPSTYEVDLQQTLENLTDRRLRVEFYQYGPGDLTLGTGVYGGDNRRIRFGYLLKPNLDPAQLHVRADEFLLQRRDLVSSDEKRLERLWPNPQAQQNDFALSYAAMTNRYFGLAVYDPVSDQPGMAGAERVFDIVQSVYPQVLYIDKDNNAMALELHLQPQELAPGASETLSMSIFAGPLDPELLDDPPYSLVGLDKLIVYRFGCAWCTFQWLAHVLLWFLGLLHDYVLFDWALAIMALVAVVRGLLHPLTKKAQINMSMFGKQMQSLKPKMDKVKEKYADDPKRQQLETQKLMREQGVNPANMLGCLPMFLQMPIWIALYAMLFYAIELRQQPAFFGIFQQFGGWEFMADLSLPDRFIQFNWSFTIPLMGEISSLNILPLLMGLIFFFQQKYLTPTSTAALSKEQETQQKIMKVMMVVLFPLFLYNAPSGLTLYILTSSSVSILESRYIRSHINELDVEEFMKSKKRKGPSFLERMEEERKRRQGSYSTTPKRSGKKRK
jgi:YidC/Oxa1 family membrane protein insertase